jgi:hypothetical protein
MNVNVNVNTNVNVVPPFIIRDLIKKFAASENEVRRCLEDYGEVQFVHDYQQTTRDDYVFHIVNENEVYDACIFFEGHNASTSGQIQKNFSIDRIENLRRFYKQNDLEFFDVIRSFLIQDPDRWTLAKKYHQIANGKIYGEDPNDVIYRVMSQLNQVLK